MIKLKVIESTRYVFNQKTMQLERYPYKEYRINASSDEVNENVGQALDTFIRELVRIQQRGIEEENL